MFFLIGCWNVYDVICCDATIGDGYFWSSSGPRSFIWYGLIYNDDDDVEFEVD